MKKLLLVLALFILPAAASAQCNGVFPNSTVCGNATGASNTPRPTSPAAFQGAAGGTNGQTQYNNSGALAGYTPSGDVTVVPSTGVETVGKINGVPINPAGSTSGDILQYNGTSYLHMALVTSINAACTISPNTCANVFGYISPLWYGAKCDNTTDDLTALQTMLSASSGKSILIPAGTCLTSNTLTLPITTTITGVGREISSIKITTCNALFTNSNPTAISLTNFWLQGSDACTSWSSASVLGGLTAGGQGKGFTIQNTKWSGFNSNTWLQIAPSGTGLANLTITDNLFATTTADIPTDPTATNNINYLFYMLSGTSGNGSFSNEVVARNRIEGTGVCFGITLFGDHRNFRVEDNLLYQVGLTNFTAHCGNGLGAHNSDAILVYDNHGDGFPSNDGQILGNKVISPQSAGIYEVCDGSMGGSVTANVLIANNLIDNQTSQEDSTIARGAIVVSVCSNVSVANNLINGSFGGIAITAQFNGTVSATGNFCRGGAGASSVPYCIYLIPAPGTANSENFIVRGNYLEQQSAGSSVIRVNATSGNYFNNLDISDNTIIAAGSGLAIAGSFTSGTISIAENKFFGSPAGTMFGISSITGKLYLSNNMFSTTSWAPNASALPTAISGSNILVPDGSPGSSPCTGSSSGSTAFRQNAAWKCF